MSRTERIRETLSQPLTPEHLRAKAEEGWRAVAVEWQRPAPADARGRRAEVPYGLRASDDPHHLEEDPEEMAILRRMLAGIVQDRPLTEVAADLDRHGLRRRDGGRWTQSHVFELLPRLIEAAPDIYASDEWRRDKPELRRVG